MPYGQLLLGDRVELGSCVAGPALSCGVLVLSLPCSSGCGQQHGSRSTSRTHSCWLVMCVTPCRRTPFRVKICGLLHAAVSCFHVPQDDVLMASRGGDGTLKLWDLRAFKKPLAVWDGLDTNYANTTCCFSPDERLLCTGRCAAHAVVVVGRVWCLCLVRAVESACWAMWQHGAASRAASLLTPCAHHFHY